MLTQMMIGCLAICSAGMWSRGKRQEATVLGDLLPLAYRLSPITS
jgi:hypothetical protein